MKEHKLAAIVFTDIVGYTSRMEKDEEHTMDLLKKQRDILFPLVEKYNGRVIKEIGDGLLMMFSSAVTAVRFAMEAQNRLDDDELTIRAGIHIGDVIFEDGDVFGSAVNIAARIEPLAPSGGICVSEDVHSQIRNKEDIKSVSIGRKNLKGVQGNMEIFRVIADYEESEERINVSIFRDIWNRKVVQVLLVYALFGGLLTWVISELVSKYFLSPHLVDLTRVILICLIPSVILISYFHGKKGVSKWKRVELIGMPLNLIITIGIVLLVFGNKDLGATTTSVKVENEEGEIIERVVPKSEYRKDLAIYNFTNSTNDTSLDYLQYALSILLEYDLNQDIYLLGRSATNYFSRIRQSGYPEVVDLPLKLMREIAEYFHLKYFLTGSFNKINGEYKIHCKIYETKYTNLISDFSLSDTNVFELIDKLSVKVKHDLGVPQTHIEETTDMPVGEIFTDSDEALKYFILSHEVNLMNNYSQGIKLLNKALETDPDFAFCYVKLTVYNVNLGLLDKALESTEIAMKNLSRLTDRHQFLVKYLYYLLRQQPDKVMAVAKMWVELYPDDLDARSILAMRYRIREMVDEAIEEYKAILKLDPERYNVLNTVGDLYLQKGVFDSAYKYYKQYAEMFPQQFESYKKLGDFYYTTGDPEKARENYNRASILADMNDKIDMQIDLALVDVYEGKMDDALNQYMEALSLSANSSDSAAVFESLQDFYSLKGQYDKAVEMYEKRIETTTKTFSPKDILVLRCFTNEVYFDAKQNEKGFKNLEYLEKSLEPPLDKMAWFGYMMAYVNIGETSKAREAMKIAEQHIERFGEEILTTFVLIAKARIEEKEKNFLKSTEYYRQALELRPTQYDIHREIASNYHEMKDFEKAREHIEIALEKGPYNPRSNYEAYLLFSELGKAQKAKEHLQRAVAIWKDADGDYELAAEANMELTKLSSR